MPYVEAGTITVILATTENPSFRINSALLSRCRVVVLNKLSVDDCESIIRRALSILYPPTTSPRLPSSAEEDEKGREKVEISDPIVKFLARSADGDARVALSSLELAIAAVQGAAKGPKPRTLSDGEIKAALGKAHMQYDRCVTFGIPSKHWPLREKKERRNGDNHYDSISALHKAVRGSDADGALYWLARQLRQSTSFACLLRACGDRLREECFTEAGEDPLYVGEPPSIRSTTPTTRLTSG